eukprot:750407-Hanusia_phi.AAC.2
MVDRWTDVHSLCDQVTSSSLPPCLFPLVAHSPLLSSPAHLTRPELVDDFSELGVKVLVSLQRVNQSAEVVRSAIGCYGVAVALEVRLRANLERAPHLHRLVQRRPGAAGEASRLKRYHLCEASGL